MHMHYNRCDLSAAWHLCLSYDCFMKLTSLVNIPDILLYMQVPVTARERCDAVATR